MKLNKNQVKLHMNDPKYLEKYSMQSIVNEAYWPMGALIKTGAKPNFHKTGVGKTSKRLQKFVLVFIQTINQATIMFQIK